MTQPHPSATDGAYLHRLAALVDEMPIGVIVYTVDDVDDPGASRIIHCNEAASSILGIDVSGLVGATVTEVFPSSAESGGAAALLDAHRSQRTLELPLLRYDGDQIRRAVYRRTIVPLPGAEVAALFEDVTERVEADQRRADLLDEMVRLTDDERTRLAHWIHDHPLQQLSAVVLHLDLARRRLEEPDALVDHLESALAILQRTGESLRRVLTELAPPELTDHGLQSALERVARHFFAGTGVNVTVTVDPDRGDGPGPGAGVDADAAEATDAADAERVGYRIAVEALANARAHAEPQTVDVRFAHDGRWLVGCVEDDGVGIDLTEVAHGQPGHLGLRSMRDRAEASGGTFDIGRAAARGTRVSFRLPVTTDAP
jgi:signal transduction histidine kinase